MQPIEFQISAERQFAAEDVQKHHLKADHIPGNEVLSRQNDIEQKLNETRVNASTEKTAVDPDAKNESQQHTENPHAPKPSDSETETEELPTQEPGKGTSLDLLA